VAAGIESLLLEDRFRVQRTMPAEMLATPGFLVMNNHPLGIAPEMAEMASWRAGEAHRFNVEPGFVLLGVAPPARHGERSMLLSAYDPQDGSGTQLLGAWWLGPDMPSDAVAAFSKFVAQYGAHMSDGRNESLFFLRSIGAVPPQPAHDEREVELHALRQTRQFVGMIGWAWCFGIDLRKYRHYLSLLSM
jgi:hypothetical protein